jgi:hypothetical protein
MMSWWNKAAEINTEVIKKRLDYSKIQAQVIETYKNIYKSL